MSNEQNLGTQVAGCQDSAFTKLEGVFGRNPGVFIRMSGVEYNGGCGTLGFGNAEDVPFASIWTYDGFVAVSKALGKDKVENLRLFYGEVVDMSEILQKNKGKSFPDKYTETLTLVQEYFAANGWKQWKRTLYMDYHEFLVFIKKWSNEFSGEDKFLLNLVDIQDDTVIAFGDSWSDAHEGRFYQNGLEAALEEFAEKFEHICDTHQGRYELKTAVAGSMDYSAPDYDQIVYYKEWNRWEKMHRAAADLGYCQYRTREEWVEFYKKTANVQREILDFGYGSEYTVSVIDEVSEWKRPVRLRELENIKAEELQRMNAF